MKGDKAGDFEGIKMKCVGFKTRFGKPFQNVTIEVPYDVGIDPYSGLLDVAISQGVVSQGGSWYTLGDDKRQQKTMDSIWYEKILTKLEQTDTLTLSSNAEEDLNQIEVAAAERRKKSVDTSSNPT